MAPHPRASVSLRLRFHLNSPKAPSLSKWTPPTRAPLNLNFNLNLNPSSRAAAASAPPLLKRQFPLLPPSPLLTCPGGVRLDLLHQGLELAPLQPGEQSRVVRLHPQGVQGSGQG